MSQVMLKVRDNVAPMQVQTERFGVVEVERDRVVTFDEGLPGFPEARRFTLIEVPESGATFFWIQSVDDPGLAFLSVVPWPYFPDYTPELPELDQDLLGLEAAEDALVLCLLTVDREHERVTANLLGPVIVNQRNRAGRQVVLAEQDLPTQAPLADAA